MNRPRSHRAELFLERMLRRFWHAASTVLALTSVGLFFTVLLANVQKPYVVLLLSVAFATAIFALIFFLVGFSRYLRQEQRKTTEELQQMADNIQEVFWTIDARNLNAVYASQAYESITGRTLRSLTENPASYRDLIHPSDRAHVLQKLSEATGTGQFDEKFRIVRPGGEVRWVWARGSPVRDAAGIIVRMVGSALEITAEKQAQEQVAENLGLARSAWAESDALRKATLSLVQDLRMDSVLDALLRSLADLVPYTLARVLIPEGGPHVLALGEKRCPEDPEAQANGPLTLNADESPFLKRILSEQKSLLVPDTATEQGWSTFPSHAELRSWLSVPLVASGQYLGFLSVGHTEPGHLTASHLRRTELLAIPAAAAIQNSRLYERAAIYGEELERRVRDLSETQRALGQSEAARRISEERFQKVFRSSPIPFSITTISDGRFLDVNSAFEQRYGYLRAEVIGRTVHELRIWEDARDRSLMLAQLERGPIRNVITRLRSKSGEIKLTVYSADKIQFEGQTCILAVSGDLLQNNQSAN